MWYKKVIIKLPYITEEIFIGEKIIDVIISNIGNKKYNKHILIVDTNIMTGHTQYIKKLIKNLNIVDTIIVYPKLYYKDFRICEKIIKRLVKTKISRNSCLISVGGGYVADITGYVASNYMRGIDFIQIPTTLMGMVDSVIGKVAINFDNNKNLLGSFYSPRYVFSDLNFLLTLKKEEIILGLSEVWKHALIKRNNNIIKKIENYLSDFSNKNFIDFIYYSIKIKASCVMPDYNDKKGIHKALSLGHTLANFLEKNFKIRHGAAVIYGIIFAAILSKNSNNISVQNYNQIIRVAKKFEENIKMLEKIKQELNIKKVLESFIYDKISENNLFNFVIPTNYGYFILKNVPKYLVVNSLLDFKNLYF